MVSLTANAAVTVTVTVTVRAMITATVTATVRVTVTAAVTVTVTVTVAITITVTVTVALTETPRFRVRSRQVHLHKMPRLWVDYLTFVVGLGLGTRSRRTFDRALQALPITQHDKVWVLCTYELGYVGLGLFWFGVLECP